MTTEPIRDFRTAAKSALRLAQLEKDALLLQGQIQAKEQLIRAIWGVIAAICIVVGFLISMFWISWLFFQRGATPLQLALANILIFGSLIALSVWKALKGPS